MKLTFQPPSNFSFRTGDLKIIVKAETVSEGRQKAGELFCAAFLDYQPEPHILGGVGLRLCQIEED